MSIDSPSGRARALWQEQAAAPDAVFGTPGRPAVLVSPASALAPPSWVGVVTIGDPALITAPTTRAADSVRNALTGLPTDRPTDPSTVTGLLPVADTLGPAALAYLAPNALRPPGPTGAPTGRLTPGHAALRALSEEAGEEDAGEEDAGESGLEEITSPVFVVRDGGAGVLAAAGYAPAVAGPPGRLPPGRGGAGLPGAGRSAERTAGLNAVRQSTPDRSGPARAHSPTISWMQTILTRMARANSVEYPLLIRLSLARLLAYATIAGLPT